MIVCFLWWCSDGNRTCVDSVSKKKEPKWLFFRRDTPQKQGVSEARGGLCVKRLMRTDLKISRERKGGRP